AELASKPDGAWVTVGGLITQAKKIRTKSGDPMMFATLDDLDGQVEMLIFNSSYASNESKADVDKRVIVRGRVDHKERGETKLVVQEVEPFEPTAEEIAGAGTTPCAHGRRARRAQGRRAHVRRDFDRRPESGARTFPRGRRGAARDGHQHGPPAASIRRWIPGQPVRRAACRDRPFAGAGRA